MRSLGPKLESGYNAFSRGPCVHVRELGKDRTLCGVRLSHWQYCSRSTAPSLPEYVRGHLGCRRCRRSLGL